MIRTSPGEKVFQSFNAVFIVGMMIVMIYPLWFVLNASISDPATVVQNKGFILWPHGFTLGSYRLLFRNPMVVIGFGNSVFYLIAGTAINLILTTLGAYPLSKKGLKLKRPILFMISFTMFFQGGLIPLYLVVRGLGLLDSRLSLLLPHAINAYNLILMRTYFMSIPDSFDESAKMDGANDFLVLLRIIVPLSTPVIAVMILYYGVWHWNSWFRALIYLNNRIKYPIQLILREILISSETESMTTDIASGSKQMFSETVKYAAIIVSTVPILAIYPFLQKYFVKGVMVGGIKE